MGDGPLPGPRPDSIGVHLHGPRDAELLVVLHRGGWADVDYVASTDDAGALPSPALGSAAEFGALLDVCVTRVFVGGDGDGDGDVSADNFPGAGPVRSRGE